MHFSNVLTTTALGFTERPLLTLFLFAVYYHRCGISCTVGAARRLPCDFALVRVPGLYVMLVPLFDHCTGPAPGPGDPSGVGMFRLSATRPSALPLLLRSRCMRGEVLVLCCEASALAVEVDIVRVLLQVEVQVVLDARTLPQQALAILLRSPDET